MTELSAERINVGDPVTYDVINNIIGDLKILKEAQAAKFNLSLTQTGGAQDPTIISQKVYSTVITKSISDGPPKTHTWTFPKGVFKNPPNCWIQLKNTNTGTLYTAFNFTIVITSVSISAMTFQVRGKGFTKATHDFVCFAADA